MGGRNTKNRTENNAVPAPKEQKIEFDEPHKPENPPHRVGDSNGLKQGPLPEVKIPLTSISLMTDMFQKMNETMSKIDSRLITVEQQLQSTPNTIKGMIQQAITKVKENAPRKSAETRVVTRQRHD